MAIAGLHNVSVLDSLYPRESQTQAPRQAGEDGIRVNTRASSVLQMWRELEDEHVVGRTRDRVSYRMYQHRSDGFVPDILRTDSSESHGSEHSGDSEDVSMGENEWSEGQVGLQNDHDYTSENSTDIGVAERGRVRQVFREWMNSSAGECPSNVSHLNNGSRAEWLGEPEQERVRAIREWVQLNSQRRGACGGGSRGDQPAESGSQIERIRDGLVVNQNEGRIQHVRRGIRKLCGRQALLDMVKKSELERKTELQALSEHRAVTNFPHRNRIQSLLRGWFLRNGRSTDSGRTDSGRPLSIAERELGMLRQKHTVSGLRGGFISRLDDSVCAQPSGSASDISNDNTNSNVNEQTQGNNSHEIINDNCEQSESNYGGSDQEHDSHGTTNNRDDLGGTAVEHVDTEESNTRLAEEWPSLASVNPRLREWQWSPDERILNTEQNVGTESQEGTANGHAQETLQVSGELGNEEVESGGDEAREQPEPSRLANDLESNTLHRTIRQESDSEVPQWLEDHSSESEEREWDQDIAEYTEWSDDVGDEDTDENQQPTTELGWSVENEGTENRVENETPEEWNEDGGFQEAVGSWLEEPSSDQEAAPVSRADTFYFPDDDNVYNREIRELLSRRRVSNLLGSGFRESLNQLIQSYVERQGNAAMEWEQNGDQEPEPASANMAGEARDNAALIRPPVSLPLPPRPPPPPPPPRWDHDSHHQNWTQHDIHNRLGIDWEMVNDMRIDMGRLQQRMNNLQRMLETCMDMQLELQRSIRQEVSAALNRSPASQGLCEVGLSFDESKWDHVRKGICCVCCISTIDSLLYRCGHMCTCSNCASELVESRGKCPMCKAPVLEVVRAYSIQ